MTVTWWHHSNIRSAYQHCCKNVLYGMWDKHKHCSQPVLRCLPKCSFHGCSSEIAVNCSKSLSQLTLHIVALNVVTKDALQGCGLKNQPFKVSSVTQLKITMSTVSRNRRLYVFCSYLTGTPLNTPLLQQHHICTRPDQTRHTTMHAICKPMF